MAVEDYVATSPPFISWADVVEWNRQESSFVCAFNRPQTPQCQTEGLELDNVAGWAPKGSANRVHKPLAVWLITRYFSLGPQELYFSLQFRPLCLKPFPGFLHKFYIQWHFTDFFTVRPSSPSSPSIWRIWRNVQPFRCIISKIKFSLILPILSVILSILSVILSILFARSSAVFTQELI